MKNSKSNIKNIINCIVLKIPLYCIKVHTIPINLTTIDFILAMPKHKNFLD